MTCGQHVESLGCCWLFTPGSLLQSVAIQIPNDARLAPIRPAGIEPVTAVYEAVLLSLHHSGGQLPIDIYYFRHSVIIHRQISYCNSGYGRRGFVHL